MSVPSYIVRDFVHGDERSILDLYKIAFGKGISESYWRWRYLANPYGRAIIKLMFYGDELAGQYAIQPLELDVHGKKLRACFSLDTMTHPAHRGKGIFTELARKAYADAKDSNYALVYGFPNPNSFPGFTGKLGWGNYGNMIELQMDLNEAKTNTKDDVVFSSDVPPATEELWNSTRTALSVVGVPRDSKFLRWRFSPESGSKYLFGERYDPRGTLVGYMATKVYQEDTGHVVDILADGPETATALVSSAVRRFRDEGVKKLSCWIPQRMASGLKVPGLSERVNEWTYFCFKDLRPLDSEMYQRDFWFLTMADSDVY